MSGNSSASPVRGSITDPEFRHRRAAHAAKARTGVDYYITKLVEAAPPLNDEQRAKLSALLAPREAA